MTDYRDWYWFVGSQSDAVYSSAQAAMVPLDNAGYVAFSAARPASSIDSMDDLIEVLRRNNVPPYHRVAKSTIIYRFTDTQLAAAVEAFNQPENLRLRERWYAPDQPAINADDPESIVFVLAIGADPDVILAPE